MRIKTSHSQCRQWRLLQESEGVWDHDWDSKLARVGQSLWLNQQWGDYHLDQCWSVSKWYQYCIQWVLPRHKYEGYADEMWVHVGSVGKTHYTGPKFGWSWACLGILYHGLLEGLTSVHVCHCGHVESWHGYRSYLWRALFVESTDIDVWWWAGQ